MPIDPANPAVDDVLADWAKTKGAVGVRLILREGQISDRTRASTGRSPPPLDMACRSISCAGGDWMTATEAVRRNPDTVIVIDHLDLVQPNKPPPLAEPWADLPKLLALAAYPNVQVKISGGCTLSREAFPYDDIWDPVLRIIDAFRIDRCMWGTDWTRISGMLTYEQGVAPFRNTDRLSAAIGRSSWAARCRKVYRW